MPLPVDILKVGQEQNLQVSKSRKLSILVDVSEMKSLFETLGKFEIFDSSRPITEDRAKISQEHFLECYAQYVEGIKTGNLIDEAPLRPFFSSIFTARSEILYAVLLANGKYLIKPKRPVIQLQRHHFIFSDTFHSGVIGIDSVTWGIQFSYPQLYLDPKTNAIGKVEKNSAFPNTELFQNLTLWIRNHTSATPFIFKEKRINQPMRLGKQCFEWINNHPSLKVKNLYVANRNNPSVFNSN